MGRVGGEEENGDNEWDIRRRMAMKSQGMNEDGTAKG